jgi:hypothetical protein
MMTIIRFIETLFLGQSHTRTKKKLHPAITTEYNNLIAIWRNERYNDFGIERVTRLLLALSQFIFIGLYVRHISGLFGLQGRKIGIELYVLFKLLLPIAFIYYGVTGSSAVAWIVAYMTLETIVYPATLIFLSNEYAAPTSSRRSLLTLFLNYIQVCLDYAVLYSHCNIVIGGFFNKPLISNMQAIYFSFVTSATVGYGDIYPVNPFGQFLVITQILLFLVFAAIFLNFFISKLQALDNFDTETLKDTDEI